MNQATTKPGGEAVQSHPRDCHAEFTLSEILPLPLRYTQSQGQNDKGKLGGRMTRGEGLAMTGKRAGNDKPLSVIARSVSDEAIPCPAEIATLRSQ